MSLGDGRLSGLPNVACAFLKGCGPSPSTIAPPTFFTPGLDVPCMPNVEAVGATPVGNLDLYMAGRCVTIATGGISA